MKRVKPGKSLQDLFPNLVGEWSFSRNSLLTPKDVSYGSKRFVWWVCSRGHEWKTSVCNRTGRGTRCPKCVSATSDFELRLYSEILYFFPRTEHRYKLGTREVDVYIPDLNVGIEFDGYFWHKDKLDKDNRKALSLRSSGITLIRLRDEGLPLNDGDLQVARNSKSKCDIDKLFLLLADFCANNRLRQRLGLYLRRRTFINSSVYKSLLHSLPGPLPGKSLADFRPDLIKEWHVVKNGSLTPSKMTLNSGRVVWWKCEIGHEWATRISHRAKGSGCPYCAGNCLSEENCLSLTRADLLKQWDFKKNRILPDNVTEYSAKKVWWICSKGHSWRATVGSRASGCGCPFCSGRKATPENNFSLKYPHLVALWNVERNGKLTPNNITPSTSRFFWWKCPKGHEWRQALKAFILNKSLCPLCSGNRVSEQVSLRSLNPALSTEWNHKRNGKLKPSDVHAYSNKKVWWKCPKGHEWQATITSRSSGNGCGRCTGVIATPERNLVTAFPHLTKEWNYEKNKELPESFTPHSNIKVWWKCSKGHEWQIAICVRSRGNNCPFCSGKRTCSSNSLLALNPSLATEWNPKNILGPDNVRPNSHKKVWWKCKKGHEWLATVASRNNRRGCAICSNKAVSDGNCLLTTHPALASEWHLDKNVLLTSKDVVAGSHKKVWWKCKLGHEWQAVVKARSNGTGCPICYRKTHRYSVAN